MPTPVPFTQEEWLQFPEMIGPTSPSNIGFSMEGGKATMEILVGTDVAWEVLSQIIGNVVEYKILAAVPVVQPGLKRSLPIAHPQFPWFFASAIESYKGHKYKKAEDYLLEKKTENPFSKLAAPSFPVFADYEEYRIQVGFEPRNYKILPDSYMAASPLNVNYFPPKNNGAVPANAINFPGIWREWERFCYSVVLPRAEYLTGDQGMYAYYIPSNAGKTPALPALVNVNKGQVKILIPSKSVIVKWFCIPYSYVTGSNVSGNRTVFDLAIGSVNQNPMFGPALDDNAGYAAGTLLLEGMNVTRIYPKPFPTLAPLDTLVNTFHFDAELLCDIDLIYAHRDPETDEEYSDTEGNNVYAGHNLLPYLQQNTWYAGIVRAAIENGNTINTGTIMPLIYPSFPMELLFCNPKWVFSIIDAAQAPPPPLVP